MLYHYGPQYSRRECIREVVFLEELCLKIFAWLIIYCVQTVFNLSARTSVAIYAVVPLKRDQGSFMYNIKKNGALCLIPFMCLCSGFLIVQALCLRCRRCLQQVVAVGDMEIIPVEVILHLMHHIRLQVLPLRRDRCQNSVNLVNVNLVSVIKAH